MTKSAIRFGDASVPVALCDDYDGWQDDAAAVKATQSKQPAEPVET